MKIKSLIAGLLLSSVAANASITISGTSILSSDLNGLSTGVFVSSTTSAFDVSLFGTESVAIGTSFATGTALNGYTILGTASINPAGGAGSALVSGVTYNLGGGVSTGNAIGVLAFASSTTSAIAGDSFSVFTGSPSEWLVPADGANLSLTGTGIPSFAGSSGSGSVVAVPEPSAFATLAGICALGFVMLRRRG